MKDDERCDNCRFFTPSECRRHAPVYLGNPTYAGIKRAWPYTTHFDWCGDFERDKPT